jgi:hypothetical protein
MAGEAHLQPRYVDVCWCIHASISEMLGVVDPGPISVAYSSLSL